MLIAIDGLIQNQGLAVNAQFAAAVSAYRNIGAVDSYKTILTNVIAAELSGGVVLSMQTLASTVLPAVTDAVTPAYISAFGAPGASDATGLSGQVLQQANLIMGNGDLSKFVQIYNTAQAYVFQNTEIVDSLSTSDQLNTTFTTMSALTTGDVSDVSRDLRSLAQELSQLGQAWDLNNLDLLGYPSALLNQLNQQAGMLPELLDTLTAGGITNEQLVQLVNNSSASSDLNDRLYRAMQTVTGALLEQVKFLLNVTTPGLTSMADLLNPAKTLPGSYRTLTLRTTSSSSSAPFGTVLTDIYLANGSVNSGLLTQFASDTRYQNLARVIPPDQALANRAIARSLQQVKNIFSSNLEEFSAAIAVVEGSNDLPLITALQQTIPAVVRNRLDSLFATGSGAAGIITLFDMIGVAAGVPYTEQYRILTDQVSQLESAGALLTLTNNTDGVYTVMQNTLDGDYNEETPGPEPEDPVVITIVIPSPLPGAGTYDSVDDAFADGLIPAAESLISAIAAGNAAATASLNLATTSIVAALVKEKQNFALTNLDINELQANDRTSIMALTSNLHEIGVDSRSTGSAAYFEAVADQSTLSGQAVIAAMREGRNMQAFNNIGIELDTQI
jgi:hypothetical protein